jgi:adenylylsulfate kinase
MTRPPAAWAIWFTGVPGSGKTTIARAAAALLRQQGQPVTVLELDEVRTTVTPAPTYSETEREVVYRALVYIALMLTGAGVPVLIDATAHRRRWRALARAVIPRFAEVQVLCPPSVCRERERERRAAHAPAGIYARAGRPGAAVPGVDVAYEAALAPELVIDSASEDVARAASRVAELARSFPPAPGRPEPVRAQWAIWITGPPGSGKSTLAHRLAVSLQAEGTEVAVLEAATLRELVLGDEFTADPLRDIAYRALAYTAARLVRLGVPVIVDAAAPRRAWRQLARDIIPHFAEVQLVCPQRQCADRERAVRWSLIAAASWPGKPTRQWPELTGPPADYEPALRPDLTLRTDAADVGSCVAQLRRLAAALAAHSAYGGEVLREGSWTAAGPAAGDGE